MNLKSNNNFVKQTLVGPHRIKPVVQVKDFRKFIPKVIKQFPVQPSANIKPNLVYNKVYNKQIPVMSSKKVVREHHESQVRKSIPQSIPKLISIPQSVKKFEKSVQNNQKIKSSPKVRTNQQISRFKDVGKGKILLIIAAGPSVNEVDFGPVLNNQKIDIMCINYPYQKVWPATYWAFCDDTQQQANEGVWNSYNGIIFNSTNVKAHKHNQYVIGNKTGNGFSLDILEGYYIGRSSTYANMQVANFLNYDSVFIMGCLPDNEKILTNNGLKSIENLKYDDLIYSSQGFKPFINRSRRLYNGDIYSIKTSMNNMSLSVTNEHPILVCDKVELKHEFKKASLLNLTDLCICPIDRTTNNDQHSEDFWWVVGLYAAEGYIRLQGGKYRYAVLCLGRHEKDLVDELRTKVKNCLNCKVTGDNRDRTWIELVVNNAEFGEFVEFHLGKYAPDKFISNYIMTLPLNKQISFIKGYLEGDGSIFIRKKRNINECTFSTASESLADALQKMLLRFDIISNITKSKRPSGFDCLNKGHFGFRHHVNITGEQLDKFGLLIDEKVKTKHGKTRFSFIIGDFLYTKIRTITKTNYNGYVNNIEVQDAHTYGCHLIMTHNCDMTGIKDAGGNLVMHSYGQNKFVPNDRRQERFAAEAAHYLWAGQHLPENIRKKFYFCSSYNQWQFLEYFNKLDHKVAVQQILKNLDSLC